MSKSIPASKTAQHSDGDSRLHSLRGALVLMVAAVTLVAGTYYLVMTLAAPDGFISHMASAARTDVDGRTLSVAAENY
jgi:hypothetical protein